MASALKVCAAILISLSFLAVPLTAFSQKKGGGPGTQQPVPLILVDANGVTVGRYFPLAGNFSLAIIDLGLPVGLLPVEIGWPGPEAAKVVPISSLGIPSIMFSSTNCTGVAYLVNGQRYAGFPITHVIRVAAGPTLLYVAGSDATAYQNELSMRSQMSRTDGSCVPIIQDAVSGFRVEQVVSLSAAFAEPYRVK